MASYSALSDLMSEHTEVFAIRLFTKLHVKTLLYYQAELAELEQELHEVEEEDRACNAEPRKHFHEHFKSLSGMDASAMGRGNEAGSQDARSRLQWHLVMRIRNTLKEYDEAILRYTGICSASHPPRSRSMARLRQWLWLPEFGNSFISGKVEGVWDSPKGFRDFAVPKCSPNTIDGLTFHFASLIVLFKSWWQRSKIPHDQLHVISVPTKTKLNRIIVTATASMFPVIPIIILFFINKILIRLGLVLLFTVLFSLVMVLGLEVDPDKTLAVTTAFAAIQVVFVGSTNSGSEGTTTPGR